MPEQIENRLRVVVIGGVAGGASAAARARRCHANAEITILEKGPFVSFANCGLPYHLGGEIEDRERLLVATPELFWKRFRIRVRTEHEVTKIDRSAQTVTGRTAEAEEFKLPYDRLILATGSEALCPEAFRRAEAANVFQLWTLGDLDRILAYMKSRPCKKALVVGAGFVGLEVVEQLVRRNIQVTLVERLPQVLSPMDSELAKMLELELEKSKVKLCLGATVQDLLVNSNRVTAVKLESGDTLTTDLVIAGAGVRPRTQLAELADLELGENGGVKINEFCQTSDPRVYAVGDIVEYHHAVLDAATRMPLAGPANRAGRIAGEHATCGDSKPLRSVMGTSIVRVFGLAAGTTGLNERTCRSQGIECRCATVQATHHASYFPGARTLTLKLLYNSQGTVLGAQAVGAEGVDKRLDVISTLLHFGGTIDDLAGLDLSYAPPYGSAKDILHMAAFVAQNDLAEAPSLVAYDANLDGFQVIDVRNASELERLAPVDNATHIPLDELHDRLDELDASLPTVTVCHSGKRAHVAACLLRGRGFSQVHNMNGGMSIRRLKRD